MVAFTMRNATRDSIVGSAAHQALAQEVAERSITRVRDRDGLLPLRLAPGASIHAVMPPARYSSTR